MFTRAWESTNTDRSGGRCSESSEIETPEKKCGPRSLEETRPETGRLSSVIKCQRKGGSENGRQSWCMLTHSWYTVSLMLALTRIINAIIYGFVSMKKIRNGVDSHRNYAGNCYSGS